MAPGRRPADPALEQARAAQRVPTVPSAKRSARVQDTYPAYDDLPWEKIEEFLKAKWPRWDFKPSRVRCASISEEMRLTSRTVQRQVGLRSARDTDGGESRAFAFYVIVNVAELF
jgi:hypothetical protein